MTNAYRITQQVDSNENLVFSLDRYDTFGVLEVFSDKIDIEMLYNKLKTEHSLTDIIAKEVFNGKKSIVFGNCPERITVEEKDFKFIVNLKNEQDTGLPLDKSELRKLIKEYSNNKEVLDLFGYTGHLSIYASASELNTVSIVEADSKFVQKIKKNFEINSTDLPQIWDTNFWNFIEMAKESRAKWDMILVDLSDYNLERLKDFDLQKDHTELIKTLQNRLLKQSGTLIFTTNVKGFVLDQYIRPGADKLTNQIATEAFKPLKNTQAFAFYN